MAAVRAGVVRPPRNMVIMPSAMIVVWAKTLFRSVLRHGHDSPP